MSLQTRAQTIYVGLSGGVDSSVSASLLCKEGHNVVGVFMKGWHPPFVECSYTKDRQDALHIAAKLGIPFVEFDASKYYEESVVSSMLSSYKTGVTPNPDVLCNKEIKFGIFLKWALSEGADGIATGHYAQIHTDEKNKYHLLAGADQKKDQSYFLWMLTQEILERVRFPIGGMEKSIVRSLAKKMGLRTAEKKDSQGLCFVGELSMQDFLRRYANPVEGAVLDSEGREIGTHSGALLYTTGQRHGLHVGTISENKSPLYVVSQNVIDNTVTAVTKKEITEYQEKIVTLSNCNWMVEPPKKKQRILARFRHGQERIECSLIEATGAEARVALSTPQLLPRGQSFVCYQDEECLGGGIVT